VPCGAEIHHKFERVKARTTARNATECKNLSAAPWRQHFEMVVMSYGNTSLHSRMRPARLLCFLLVLLASFGFAPAFASTYYVRTDGGTAEQCTGLANAAYPGTGTGQACAWSSPMIALPPPPGYGQVATPRIQGGDTLKIAHGSYMIGYGAPGTGSCNTGMAYACTMAAVPSGTTAAPTRILGDCAAPPEFWGTQRASTILNLNGSSNVEVGCVEVTDHHACIENHCQMSGTCAGEINRCQRDTYPYGTWAENGLTAADSHDVYLHDLTIHGMGNAGTRVGRLTDWTMERVRIHANGFGGWDNDIRNGQPTADTGNHGTILFRDSEISFNGCAERYPSTEVYGCWGQNEGGYGDGLGAGPTGGNWVFENVHVHHNTQDGLDLLYADGNGSITMDRVLADGNAGNQLKTAGATAITNSIIVGNCAYFSHAGNIGVGNMRDSDSCRAGGDAIAMLPGNDIGPAGTNTNHVVTLTLKNNTVTSEGNGLVMLSRGNAASTVNITSNVFNGAMNWQLERAGYPELSGGVYYYATTGFSQPTMNYMGNLFWNVKNDQCPMGSLCQDPKLSNDDLYAFNAIPQPTSPLIGWATAANSTAQDFRGYPRPSTFNGQIGYDVGAIQYQGMADERIFGNSFDN